MEKSEHIVGVTGFVKRAQLTMELFGILIQNRNRGVSVCHQTAVHHQRSGSLVRIIERLISCHEKKNADGAFHRIGDFMLQKVEAVLNNVLEIFGRRDK